MGKENRKRNINKNARKLDYTEKTILLLKYLRKNTDEGHKIASIGEIRKAFDHEELNIGNNKTVNTLIKRIANVCNMNSSECLLPQSEWRIVFDEYLEKYGDLPEEDFEEYDFEEDESDADEMRIHNLYYVPELSHEDINVLTEAVLFSRTIAAKDADRIIKTLEDHFASRYYSRQSRGICKIHEKTCYDKELLRKNLRLIQQAIENDFQIEYQFNGYTHDKRLKPVNDHKRKISPYYIVADYGRYYLLAANEKYKNTMIIRMDLMTEVVILDKSQRIPLKEIHDMPPNWDDNFSYKHFQMAYDSPRTITLRIKSEKTKQGGHKTPDYTFLHDHFGDTYEYKGIDEQDPDYDIVEVKCSPFGIVNLALQYADKMEILAPLDVREIIQEKVQILCERYQSVSSQLL